VWQAQLTEEELEALLQEATLLPEAAAHRPRLPVWRCTATSADATVRRRRSEPCGAGG
jgi:hypothetical protein